MAIIEICSQNTLQLPFLIMFDLQNPPDETIERITAGFVVVELGGSQFWKMIIIELP